MRTTEYIHEMRGIARSDLIEYFVRIGGVLHGNGRISGPDWEVTVGEENQVRLGLIYLTSVGVVFQAREERYLELVASFRLKFLSAGG